MVGYLHRVEIDEVTNTMVRDAPELRPVAEGANRRLFALGENAAEAQTDDVGQRTLTDRED